MPCREASNSFFPFLLSSCGINHFIDDENGIGS
jgi:hypothetical protein